jgi:hypothetical protein
MFVSLALAAGAGCTSPNAEAEGVQRVSDTVSAGIADPVAAKAFVHKRAALVSELAGTVEEVDEQVEMITDVIEQREATRDSGDEDASITAVFASMDLTRSTLARSRARVDQALAKLRNATAADWAATSWSTRLAIHELEAETEAATTQLYQ